MVKCNQNRSASALVVFIAHLLFFQKIWLLNAPFFIYQFPTESPENWEDKLAEEIEYEHNQDWGRFSGGKTVEVLVVPTRLVEQVQLTADASLPFITISFENELE